jgi:signal transduction histidine kinase
MFIPDNYQTSSLLTGVSTAFIAAFVISKGWRHQTNRVFTMYTIVISTWSFCWTMMYAADTAVGNLFWARLTNCSATMIPPTFLHFTQCVLKLEKSKKHTIFRKAAYFVGFIFSSIAFFKIFIPYSSPNKSGFRFFMEPGPAFGAFVVFFFITVSAIFLILFRTQREEVGIKKTQLTYMSGAYILGYAGGTTAFLPVYNWPMPSFALYSIPLAHIIIVYAIFKHKLLEISIVLRRAALMVLIYAGLIVVLLPLVLLSRTLSTPFLRSEFLVPALVCGIFLSIGPFLYAYLLKKSTFFQERVVFGVTHEFKSPLASIQCATEILTEEIGKLKAPGPIRGKIADYLLMIQNNSQRLEKFIQDLLQVAKIEHGQPELKVEEVNLNEVCQKALDLYKPLAEQKNIKMEFFPNGVEPIQCDPEKIQMVVSNLLSNAVKFTTHGQIKLKIESKGKETLVSVQDTGLGIPAEDLPYIFDKFYQGKNGNGTKGTGLGLSIVKGWVEAHGGRVKVESGGINQGTYVSFTLPG